MVSKQDCDRYLAEEWANIEWSFSRINSFYSCPLSWYLTYVKKIKSENFHAYVGSSVHQIFEDYYLKGRELGLDISTVRGVMQRKFDLAMEKNPHQVFPNMQRSIYNNIRGSLGEFDPRPGITDVEKKYQFEVRGWPFVAYIDFDEDIWWHGDYKSRWDMKYLYQQYLYMEAKMQCKPTDMKGKPLGFSIIEYKNNLNEVRMDYLRPVWVDARTWAVGGIERIKKALETASFPPDNRSTFFCEQLCRKKECPFSKVNC